MDLTNGNPVLTKVCWKCSKKVDASWIFCCQCSASLMSQKHLLPAPEHKTDVAFLNDVFSYAWYNRNDAALTLYDSIIEAPHIATRHKIISAPARFQRILAAKIFNEYMALLEAFGMLCLSIYNRKTVSLRWSLINTQPVDIKQFYQRVQDTKRPKLEGLLNFPRIDIVVRAAKAIGLDEEDKLSIQEGYEKILENIRLVADQYLAKRGLLVRNYNKLKHGFALIEGQWIDPPLDPDKIAIYSFDEIGYLSMKQQDVKRQIQNIENITLMGGQLMRVCLALDKINMLFD